MSATHAVCFIVVLCSLYCVCGLWASRVMVACCCTCPALHMCTKGNVMCELSSDLVFVTLVMPFGAFLSPFTSRFLTFSDGYWLPLL